MYACMYVCMLNCIYVCMYVCILFYISHFESGSLVSVGVGPWYCKGLGSNPLCGVRRFGQVLFSWGGDRKEISHNILQYVKFPTNRTFHGNFPISKWENFSGNLTCMLE